MSEDLYEMRRKMLALQKELIKGAAEVPKPQPKPVYTQQPETTAAKEATSAEAVDMMSLLKEIYSNQHKIMTLLVQINSKLK